MKFKFKKLVILCMVSVLLLGGTLGSVAYAGNQNGQVLRDRDCVDEPKHIYCNLDCTYDSIKDRLQQRLRDRDMNCSYDNEMSHLRLRDNQLEDIVEVYKEYKDIEKSIEEAKKDKNRKEINKLVDELKEVKEKLEEMLKDIKSNLEDFTCIRTNLQNRFRNNNRVSNQIRQRINYIESLIKFIEKDINE